MAQSLELTLEQIDLKKHSIYSKLKSLNYPIQQLINNYHNALNPEKVLESLTEFGTIQALAKEHLRSEYNGMAMPLATLIAANIGSAVLGYSEEDKPALFSGLKIDFSKGYPVVFNEALAAYKDVLESTIPQPKLEYITQSFFKWLIEDSRDNVNGYKALQKDPVWLITVRDKKYRIDLNELPTGKKSSIDLSGCTFDYRETNTPKNTVETIECDYLYGLDHIIGELRDQLMIRIKHKQKITEYFDPKRAFPNYLLYGPPGTGKTTIISGIARKLGVKLIAPALGEIGSMYINNTSNHIHDTYQTARNYLKEGEQAVFVFWDEFDQLAKLRIRGKSSEDDKVTTTFNQELDGTITVPGVITFAASNRPDCIDPAIARRFHYKFYVGYPEKEEDIINLHKLIIRKIEARKGEKRFEELDYSQILEFSRKNEKFKSGAEINEVLFDVAIRKFTEHLNAKTCPLVTTDDVVARYAIHQFENENIENKLLAGTDVLTRC